MFNSFSLKSRLIILKLDASVTKLTLKSFRLVFDDKLATYRRIVHNASFMTPLRTILHTIRNVEYKII